MNGGTFGRTGPDRIEAVIFDLDGVIRDWNNHVTFAAEEAAGIEAGSLMRHAFADDIFGPVVTGATPWERWIDDLEHRYVAEHGPVGKAIVAAWSEELGTLQPEMVDLLREVRERVPVALLTNGTTRLALELDHHGLRDLVDHVVNTAEVGVAKPDAGAYQAALGRLRVDAPRAAFIDDLVANVEAAAALGIAAHHHVDHPTTRLFLNRIGVIGPHR